MKIKKTVVFSLISFLLFFIAAAYITYPMIFHIGDSVTGYGDELLIAWTQNWVIHALFTNPIEIFNTNLYYPYKETLAFSDFYLTSSILSILPVYIFGQPIVAFNFTVISSIILVPFSLFLLTYYLTKDYLASLLSGFLIQFSPNFLDKKVHVQVLAVEWIPLSVLFFILFHKRKNTWLLVFSLFFFLLQTYNSFMPGYFIIFFDLVYLIYLFFTEKKFLRIFLLKRNIIVILTAFLLLLPVIIPYYQVSFTYNARRDIRDAIHFAIQPEDFLYSGNTTRLDNMLLHIPFVKQTSVYQEIKPGYIGLVFTLLCFLTFIYVIKKKSKPLFFNVFGSTALIGLLLCLGPLLHINRVTIHKPFPIPLPYALLYYIAPGFQGFRDSERFEIMFILYIAVAIGIILSTMLKGYSIRWRMIIYFILFVGIITEYKFPMNFIKVQPTSDFPTVYRWLATTPSNSSSIIMPIYDWYMYDAGIELKRDYYSTANWRRTVNGASGYAPLQWEKLVSELHHDFPDKQSINALQQLRVTYLIVDTFMYDKEFQNKVQPHDGTFILNALRQNHSLHFIKKFGSYYIYSL